jgi:hypothetical protein
MTFCVVSIRQSESLLFAESRVAQMAPRQTGDRGNKGNNRGERRWKRVTHRHFRLCTTQGLAHKAGECVSRPVSLPHLDLKPVFRLLQLEGRKEREEIRRSRLVAADALVSERDL